MGCGGFGVKRGASRTPTTRLGHGTFMASCRPYKRARLGGVKVGESSKRADHCSRPADGFAELKSEVKEHESTCFDVPNLCLCGRRWACSSSLRC